MACLAFLLLGFDIDNIKATCMYFNFQLPDIYVDVGDEHGKLYYVYISTTWYVDVGDEHGKLYIMSQSEKTLKCFCNSKIEPRYHSQSIYGAIHSM